MGWMKEGTPEPPSWTLSGSCWPHCSALTPFSLSIQGTLIESWADDSPRHHGLAAPSSGEEEEIQYASLSFHKVGPQDLWGQEATNNEYSEIKIPK